ncbi:MAG: serine/threonine protein phosphatase [Hyphomicrobiales bacterium]|nr:MAG: serine/threonine protein phosphatase [Hyphomicrobiales bacterium]
MKILAFSDIHMNADFMLEVIAQSAVADVIVAAGDFANKGGSSWHIIEPFTKIRKPVVVVSGNHDNLMELTKLCNEHEHIHLLHGGGVNIDGVDFYGLGCEVPQINQENWNEWLDEEAAARMLEGCPVGCVLVTHSPAYGHCDLQIYGANEGSKAIFDCVKMKQPQLHLCGHIHNGWGVSSFIGNTPTHNLGPSVNWFEI